MTSVMVAALFVTAAAGLLLSARWLLLLAVFFLPWYSLYVDVGVALTLAQVLVILAALRMVLRMPTGHFGSLRFPLPLVLYLGWMVVVTLGFAIVFVPAAAGLRGSMRWITEVGRLSVDFLFVILPLALLRRTSQVARGLRIALASFMTLSGLGLVQAVAFQVFGLRLFPIYRSGLLNPQHVDFAAVNIGGLQVFRMNALGGEPRTLSVTLTVGIMVWLILAVYREDNSQRWFMPGLALMGVVLLGTFSTSGWLALGFGLAVLGGLIVLKVVRQRGRLHRRVVRAGATLLAMAALSLVGMVAFDFYTDGLFLNWLETVVFKGLFSRGEIQAQGFDTSVMALLTDRPEVGVLGVGRGHVHLLAREYLTGYEREYAYNAIFVARIGIVQRVAESGIPGVILWSWLILGTALQLRRLAGSVEHARSLCATLSTSLIVLYSIWLLRSEMEGLLLVFLGLGLAAVQAASSEGRGQLEPDLAGPAYVTGRARYEAGGVL